MSGKPPSTGSEGTTGTNSSAGAPSTDSTGETEGAANRHGNALVEGITTAFSWLSVIPVRGAQVFDRRTGRRAIAAAPAVAVVPGLAAVALVAALLAAPIVLAAEPGTAALRGVLAGVAIAAAAQLLTRAMHADGLADVADALGSYKDPAGAREILRDPRNGPHGGGDAYLGSTHCCCFLWRARTSDHCKVAAGLAPHHFPPHACRRRLDCFRPVTY